jgi:hypothetical protein
MTASDAHDAPPSRRVGRSLRFPAHIRVWLKPEARHEARVRAYDRSPDAARRTGKSQLNFHRFINAGPSYIEHAVRHSKRDYDYDFSHR